MFFSVPGVKKIYYSNFFRIFSGCFFYDFSGFFPGCRNTSCRVPCYHVVTDFPFYGFFKGPTWQPWEPLSPRDNEVSRSSYMFPF